MTVADIEAIVGGYHGDAFRVLGPHFVQKRDAQPRWEVRAFLPQAHSADVVIGETVVPMVKRHKEGLFVALLDGEQQTYRIRARPPDGRSVEYDDPYRFPPLLSALIRPTGRELPSGRSWRRISCWTGEKELPNWKKKWCQEFARIR